MEFNVIDIFLWSFSSLYAVTVLSLAFCLARYHPKKTGRKPFVSVLIAARNESGQISQCLKSLLVQTYDQDLFEVIVIDDRSTDDTAANVLSLEKQFRYLKLVTVDKVPADVAPKKFALDQGIKIARGEVILCTDADCRPEKEWISGIMECFTDEVGMVVGYSPIEPKDRFSLVENFLALDSLALASVAAGSSAWGGTLTATGRSLSYRKRVFEEVGGFSKIARFVSGDDDLLLGLIRKTKWRIAYCLSNHSQVHTDPPGSFRKFANQKIRQASKGRQYSPKMILGLILFLVFNLLLITYVPWKGISGQGAMIHVIPWLIKIGSDAVILTAGAWRFGKWSYLKMYPVIAVLHPLYITVFGIWGQFGKFEWKDTVRENTMTG